MSKEGAFGWGATCVWGIVLGAWFIYSHTSHTMHSLGAVMVFVGAVAIFIIGFKGLAK